VQGTGGHLAAKQGEGLQSALEIGAPVAMAAGAASFGVSVWDIPGLGRPADAILWDLPSRWAGWGCAYGPPWGHNATIWISGSWGVDAQGQGLMDLSDLPAGVYFVRATGSDESSAGRRRSWWSNDLERWTQTFGWRG
jgi:hypothetical protein